MRAGLQEHVVFPEQRMACLYGVRALYAPQPRSDSSLRFQQSPGGELRLLNLTMPEFDDIAVPHFIFFSFRAHNAAGSRLGNAARFNELIPRNHRGLDKFRFKIAVNGGSRSWRLCSFAYLPGTNYIGTCRKKRYKPQKLI